MGNLVYELTKGYKACTSIMAHNNKTDSVFSARNMDFYPKGALAKITYDVDFYENEKNLLYKGTTFFGCIGLWTSYKPEKFSVIMNERFKNIQKSYEIMKSAANETRQTGIDSEVIPISFLTRKTTEMCSDYNCALNKLNKAEIPANTYVVISGRKSNEGALLTKGTNTTDVQFVAAQKRYPENKWYLLETNYDYFEEPAWWDNRRKVGHQQMDSIGSANVDISKLIKVLMKEPVRNRQTIYSTFMDIKE